MEDHDVVNMSLDPDEVPYGVQRFKNDNLCSFTVFKTLGKMKKDGRAVWWKDVDVVLKQQRGSKVRVCFLKCGHCEELLSAANPNIVQYVLSCIPIVCIHALGFVPSVLTACMYALGFAAGPVLRRDSDINKDRESGKCVTHELPAAAL